MHYRCSLLQLLQSLHLHVLITILSILIWHIMNSSLTQSQLEQQFQDFSKDMKDGFRSDHSFYGLKSGRVKNPALCANFNIQDPYSEILLEEATFFTKDAPTCFKEKSVEVFFTKQFTAQQLESAIQNYTIKYTENGDKYLQEYISKAHERTPLFKKRFGTSDSDSYGCCLALSYYTGVYSERISRNSNIIIKLDVTENTSKVEGMEKFAWMKCISYWMFKALHHIPLHWGQVTRCVTLKEGQDALYKVGNIVTWIQFSSSSYGEPTEYFKNRNTRFIIYSLSGRNIENFSNYGNETEVLFKPFSHFLVLSRKQEGDILFIYMREIFFGQSSKNILWVDDNIFDPNWENKGLMEKAILKEPLLNIIPKISTQTALAFIKSQLCRSRKPTELRIMSDMTRKNQNPPHNAGARFVKQLLPIYNNLKILIFTSNKAKGEEYLSELNIPKKATIEVTVTSEKALSFLKFE